MKVRTVLAISLALVSLSISACDRMTAEAQDEPHPEHNQIIVTSPVARDVTITQPYVCQIRSQRHIEIKALQEGYLEEIPIKEGQAVKKGEILFRVVPFVYKARWDAEKAEANLAQIEFEQTKKLAAGDRPVVSPIEVALYEAKLNKAKAKAAQAEVEWNFTFVKAPFDGIVDRLQQQQGSLVKKDEVLTTLSDNSVMWVYFNVPEARYLEYKALQSKNQGTSRLKLVDSRIELVLANGSKFDQDAGNVVTVEGKFNNETGNIAFRADFPNPDGLLRHGQTGTILIHRTMKNAIIIPQRATYETLDKRYVYVIGEDHVAHQRPIAIAHELEDIFVIESGITVKDKIILEGVQQVHDEQKIEEFEYRKPGEALANQKYHAE
jgi:membrane fusion protein (multidrug efflux system)